MKCVYVLVSPSSSRRVHRLFRIRIILQLLEISRCSARNDGPRNIISTGPCVRRFFAAIKTVCNLGPRYFGTFRRISFPDTAAGRVLLRRLNRYLGRARGFRKTNSTRLSHRANEMIQPGNVRVGTGETRARFLTTRLQRSYGEYTAE